MGELMARKARAANFMHSGSFGALTGAAAAVAQSSSTPSEDEGGGEYVAKAVRFAAGAYLARGGTLGVTNSPKGIVFYSFRSSPDLVLPQNILVSIPNYYLNPYDFGNIVNTTLSDGTNQFSGNPQAEGEGGTPNVDDGDWYMIARSWDVSDPDSANWVCTTVVGEPGEAPTIFGSLNSPIKTGVGFDVIWNETDFYLMGDGSEDVFREVSQLWATPGVSMTGAQMIAAFWGADNKPKSLGANGEGPTGSAPAIYCDGDAAEWADNRGTAGAFTAVGDPPTDATTSPSD